MLYCQSATLQTLHTTIVSFPGHIPHSLGMRPYHPLPTSGQSDDWYTIQHDFTERDLWPEEQEQNIEVKPMAHSYHHRSQSQSLHTQCTEYVSLGTRPSKSQQVRWTSPDGFPIGFAWVISHRLPHFVLLAKLWTQHLCNCLTQYFQLALHEWCLIGCHILAKLWTLKLRCNTICKCLAQQNNLIMTA